MRARTECTRPIQMLRKDDLEVADTTTNRRAGDRQCVWACGRTCRYVGATGSLITREGRVNVRRLILILTSHLLLHQVGVCREHWLRVRKLLLRSGLNPVKLQQPPQLCVQISQYCFLNNA